jgi:viroplasmin and RNaseH domain-containing protein
MVLHPERANRLVTQYGFDSNQLGLKEALNSLITTHFKVRYRDGHEQQLNEIVKANLLKQIMYLGKNIESNSIVKALIHEELISLDQWITGQTNLSFSDFYRTEIDNYFEDPNNFVTPVTKRLPDGSPIGSFSCDN